MKFQKKTASAFTLASIFALFLLALCSWGSIFILEKASLSDLFSTQNIHYAKKFFRELFGVGVDQPAYTNKASWFHAYQLTIETVKMSVMATGFATIAAMCTVIPAARNVANGSLILGRKWSNWFSFWLIRGAYLVSRAIPELVWAMVIIYIFKPGILPGALALALHNFGIIGKLCAEVIEDLDSRPIRNLATCGASRTQILFYGIFPAVLPRFLTYILYRWEVIMRTTIVVGFVGAGGLGQQFKLSMSFFHYTEISLLLICYLLLVFGADFISEKARNFIK